MTKISYKYWNENKVVEHIKKFIEEYGHFPKQNELGNLGIGNLMCAINKTGGFKKYHKMLGYEQYYNDEGYWTEEKTIYYLKLIEKDIGHFPIYKEIHVHEHSKVAIGILRNGGINKFRRLFGYKELCKQNFWNDEVIINKLSVFIAKYKYFPTVTELKDNEYNDLARAIDRSGGILKYRSILGYKNIDYKTYSSYKGSYVVKRGKSTEKVLYDILCDFCEKNNLTRPSRNQKLSKGNVIEFVCNTNKVIGIDITNTMCKSTVYHKWTKKDYYKYLDELWIVVVSDSFVENEYIKWNIESPSNVYVYSIDEFIEELQYNLDEGTKSTIEKYKSCTFHTREQYKKEKEGSVVTS